jgi:hypothetical protein
MLYHQTKDPYYVKDFLGHKSLASTEIYINIERTMFESACDEFTVKVTETVKAAIAKQQWSLGRKANAVDAYTSFLRMTDGKWESPRYQGIRKIPFIPTEAEVDQLISGCSRRMATFLQLLKEQECVQGKHGS